MGKYLHILTHDLETVISAFSECVAQLQIIEEPELLGIGNNSEC